MHLDRNFFAGRRLLMLALMLAGAMGAATAQTWPSKPVRIVLQFPPGGSTDVVARILAQALTDRKSVV